MNMRGYRAVHKISSDLFYKSARKFNSDAGSNVPPAVKKIVSIPSTEVGPGASKKSTYKNPEYYCYNKTSYFDAEMELSKYRLPQPSSKTRLS